MRILKRIFIKIIFDKLFNENIKHTLNTYNNEEFWKGNKLKPTLINNLSLYESIFIKKFNTLFLQNNKIINIPLTFNKDIKAHLDFVHFITNLRAQIYGIQQENIYNIKKMAGNIIPALISTTTLITSLGVMEMLRYYDFILNYNNDNKNNTICKFEPKDYFINLGINLYLESDSQKAQKLNYKNIFNDYCLKPKHLTIWDKIILDKNRYKNGSDIAVFLSNKFNTNPQNILLNDEIIYDSLHNTNKNIELKKEKLNIIETFCLDENTVIIIPKIIIK